MSRHPYLALLLLTVACHPQPQGHSRPAPAATHVATPAPTGSQASSAPTSSAATAAPAASAPDFALPPYGSTIWEVPLPDGFVPIPDIEADDAPDGAQCMGLTVRNRWERQQRGAMPYVEVSDEKGDKVYVARGRRYAAAGEGPASERMWLAATLCGDLDADGVPDLLLTERTMGAHCCYTHYAVSLTRPAKNLLMWEKGDAGTGVMPVKAKPGKSYQLISGVVTWPRFPENAAIAYSYSGAPILPIVFQLEGSEYRARTFRYAAFIAQQRERARRVCGGNRYCSAASLADWGTALIVGDWEQQRAHVDFDADTLTALNQNADTFRADLKRLLGH